MKKKPMPPRHRFLEPIYNVKEGRNAPYRPKPNSGLHTWSGGASRDRTDDLKLAKLALSQLSYGPIRNVKLANFAGAIRSRGAAVRARAVCSNAPMVGREGVEPSTSRLSGVRSNHL